MIWLESALVINTIRVSPRGKLGFLLNLFTTKSRRETWLHKNTETIFFPSSHTQLHTLHCHSVVLTDIHRLCHKTHIKVQETDSSYNTVICCTWITIHQDRRTVKCCHVIFMKSLSETHGWFQTVPIVFVRNLAKKVLGVKQISLLLSVTNNKWVC